MLPSYWLRLIVSFSWICISFSFTIPVFRDESKALLERDSTLYTLWSSIPGAQKALGDSALYFAFPRDTSNAWGITYLYGCTAIMISDGGNTGDPASKGHVVVAHLQEEGVNCINLDSAAAVNAYIERWLRQKTDEFDPIVGDTRVDLLYDGCKAGSVGIRLIKQFFIEEWELPADQLHDQQYTAGRGTALGSPDPNSPTGLAVVQWETGALPILGTLKVFFGSVAREDPISGVVYQLEEGAGEDGGGGQSKRQEGEL